MKFLILRQMTTTEWDAVNYPQAVGHAMTAQALAEEKAASFSLLVFVIIFVVKLTSETAASWC